MKKKEWKIKGGEGPVGVYAECPYCGREPEMYWDGEDRKELNRFRYCPKCGKKMRRFK